MRFNSVEFILLLLLVLIFAWYKLYLNAAFKRGGIRLASVFSVKNLRKGIRARLLFLPELLRALVLVLLVFAMMQPQYGYEQETVVRQGIDIMLALDVSGSMAAEDFKPNRIKAAQKITENFISGITDHRIGLVVFAGVALTQCPLTLDYGIVTELLRRSSIDMLKVDGTAIGDAIVNAVYKFAPDKEGEKRDKVVILLSDGENNSGIDPYQAAKIASERGIRIYTIGVASLEGARIPYYRFGRKIYSDNVPKLDEQLLKDIAFLTKGKYFRATNNQALEEIYKTIAGLEKGKIDVNKTMQYAERFYMFLFPAFALLAIEIYLRSRVFQRVF